jgi:hypothetical protein
MSVKISCSWRSLSRRPMSIAVVADTHLSHRTDDYLPETGSSCVGSYSFLREYLHAWGIGARVHDVYASAEDPASASRQERSSCVE